MRRRTIAPEFFLHSVASSCTPHARLLFVSLWTQVDREGRMRWVPLQVHGNSFPHEPDLDVPAMVAELETRGLVARYDIEGKDYLWLPGFTRWQRPHKNEPPSCLPAFPSGSGAYPDTLEPTNGGSDARGPRPCIEDQRIRGSGGLAFEDDHPAMSLALALLEAIESHSPEYSAKVSESRLQGWALEIDRSIRLDGYDRGQVAAVIRWAHRDDPRGFWRGNLLSGSKLRKQLPRLVAQGRADGWLTASPGAGGADALIEQHADLLLRYRDKRTGAGLALIPAGLVGYCVGAGVDIPEDCAPELISWLESGP